TGRNVVIDVQKISDTKQTPPQTPKPAPATANADNVVTGHQQEADEKTDFAPRNAPKSEKPAAALKQKKNYIGGGFEYRPGQGIRLFGLGQRSHLTFPLQGGSLSATGGVEGDGIGSVNYFADYILFGRLHRRVSLQLNIGSDSDPQRLLTGEMDERRNGGSGRLEFELFRDRGGSLLRFYAEGRRTTVALSQNDTIKAKQNLNTLDVGSLFLFESVEAEYPRRIRLEPRVRFGLRLGTDSPSFTKITATGNLHQSLPHRLAADISGSLALASRDTPDFELPSFGGGEVVRGFRHDDALGRRLWSLQNELWLPVPGTATDEEAGLKTFLRDNVRLAPFVDVGALSRPRTSTAGLRSGFGLGLRVIYNVIILKVDYAYGVGAAATGGGPGKFYFSIGTNLPL
ncbi:MAG TPA: BamA/TamA family outer membrane protein, partial [Pyrinomonadaceae bacterium]|nr:BamA/TamA family outer membrane protein [Pyrinomonadaceae bacterium]